MLTETGADLEFITMVKVAHWVDTKNLSIYRVTKMELPHKWKLRLPPKAETKAVSEIEQKIRAQTVTLRS